MKTVNRRRFLALTAVGAVGAAGVAAVVPGIVSANQQHAGELRLQASVGLPPSPWPAYATQVLEGTIDLKRGTGRLTSRVLAGHPQRPSNIGLPGMTRLIRITSVSPNGDALQVRGTIEDASQLSPGESAEVELLVHRAAGVVRTRQNGREVVLQMV